jgi:hypothetical protein
MANLNDKQLLESKTTDGLSVDQIMRRSVLIQMQAAEVGLEETARQNEKAIAAREQEVRQHKARMKDILNNQAEEERIQGMCHHNTGGQDRAGFYQGDGEVYGASISTQVLPTQEIYCLCARCMKEWHSPYRVEKYFPGHPEKISLTKAVCLGLFPLEEFDAMEAEFKRVLGLKARTFAPLQGEHAAACQFLIPELKARLEQESRELQAFRKLPKAERNRVAVPA